MPREKKVHTPDAEIIRLLTKGIEAMHPSKHVALYSAPFSKLAQVNRILQPYGIKAFTVASQKLMDFTDIKSGSIIISLRNKMVKEVTLVDLVDIIKRKG